VAKKNKRKTCGENFNMSITLASRSASLEGEGKMIQQALPARQDETFNGIDTVWLNCKWEFLGSGEPEKAL
jgi:hypothetical protein